MLVKSVFAALAAAGMATAHIQMVSPYPIRSEFDPENDWSNIDYSMTSPLDSDGMNSQRMRSKSLGTKISD